MATSSIFASFDIDDPVKATAFVDALDRSYRDSLKRPVKHRPMNEILTTEAAKIRELARKLSAK